MSFIEIITEILIFNYLKTIISLVFGFIVYKITKYYMKVSNLPPGPIPLPLLGNILYFRGTRKHWSHEILKVPKKYGPVFTFWLGPKPFIFITDIEIAREAFRKNDFAGRPQSFWGSLLVNENHTDIVFTDYGHTWEALRRVAHSAVMKYSVTDKLLYLAIDCVDKTFDSMVVREGLDKPFVPSEYIYSLVSNILSASAWGESDDAFAEVKHFLIDTRQKIGIRFLLWEFSSIIRFIDRKYVSEVINNCNNIIENMKNKFEDHYKDYSEPIIRDFCDALISAKNDALIERKESAPYLTDDNLTLAVLDLFVAGVDTTRQTVEWLLLFFLYYPQIQQKLKEEIESEIGDRIPTHEDRNRCHYVMAFISETLRFRNVIPMGFFHSAVVDSKIANYSVAKGTGIFLFQGHTLNNSLYWTNPDEFKPERFLQNGKFITTRPSAFIPFGVGRRVCLGEKLVIADLFLVLVRFIQKTSEYDITLDNHNGIEPNPDITHAIIPNEFKIRLKRIY